MPVKRTVSILIASSSLVLVLSGVSPRCGIRKNSRGAANMPFVVCSVGSSEAHQNLGFAESRVEACQCELPSFHDRADNYFVPLDNRGQAGVCAYGIGANHDLYGKLIVQLADPARDVWMSGYVFFPHTFQLPQDPLANGEPCNMGVHMWRLYDSLSVPQLSMDANIPAGTDHLQLYIVRRGDLFRSGSPFKNTVYRPASKANQGRWQYWEFHIDMGEPGNSDGFVRFYADGRLIDSLEHQEFYPPGFGKDRAFRFADLQSNISEGPCNGSLWPVQNGWLAQGVQICSQHRCERSEMPPEPNL